MNGSGTLAVQVLIWTMRPRAFLRAGIYSFMTESAPNTFDVEFAPDSVERQNLDRPGGQDACVVDEQIEACIAEVVGDAASPGLHAVFLCHIADRQADTAARGVLHILDLGCGHGRPEYDIAFGGEPERDIAAEATARASDRSGSARMLGCR